jgi:threonine/homoserine/homoserine lactone efflux protein
MAALTAFVLGFLFSFIGSIPPGTLNLIAFQMGLNHQIRTALRFTLAVALIEYPYAWLAVKFANLITSTPAITENMKLITAVVMTSLGILNLLPSKQKASPWVQQFNNSGFRRGVLLSILNPMALPFWVGVTAYLTEQGWLTLGTPWELHGYLVGIAVGSIALLVLLIFLAKRIVTRFGDIGKLKQIPGYMLLALGLYALAEYLWF